MSNYTFARLVASNLKDLYILFTAVYNRACPKYYFERKYDTAYTGASYVGYLAYLGQTPVAYYGVIPTFLSIGQQKVLAAQSCDTMTHPTHRKKGLFVKLAQQTFELAKREGIHLVFGFPNQNSHPGFIKHLGFSHAHTMHRYTIRFSNTPFKLLLRKLGLTGGRQSAEPVPNILLQEGFDGLIYDKAYTAYKHYNSNTIVSAKEQRFWVNLPKGGWIGALAPLNSEGFSQTLRHLENLTKASSITFMVSPDTGPDKALSKNAKAEQGFAVIIKNLSGKYETGRLKFQFSDIDIF